MKALGISTLFSLASYIVCDEQFKSRPDLTIPKWNISSDYNAVGLAPGYIFVTPYSASNADLDVALEQPGAYIYNNNGDLVWSSFAYFGGVSLNFQAAEINGQSVLYAFEGQFNSRGGHGYGHIKLLDNHYRPIKEIRGGNHQFIDIHEFHLVENNTKGLIESYSPVKVDLSDYNEGDDKRTWIVNAHFQELNLDNNELIFEWKSLDHVSPKNSNISLTSDKAGDGYTSSSAWDYFHINSVDKNSDGDYLVSARHTSTIYKISGKTGEILWRLSTLGEGDLEVIGETNFTLGYQHHARFLQKVDEDTEIISFFDNNAYSVGHSDPEASGPSDLSSGKIIRVNNRLKTVELLQQFNAPKEHPLSAKSQGSFQSLPNGNKLINWGSAGAITEYNDEGDVLFFAKLDSGERGPYVQSYRAFKFEWEGHSNEDVAVYQQIEGKNTVIYISWNGDTVTKQWEVVDAKSGKIVATFDKSGFETQYTIEGHVGTLIVNALDAHGTLLGSSANSQTTLSESKTNTLYQRIQYILGNIN